MIYSAPQWQVCCSLDQTRREINELRLWLFGAVAGHQLDGWSAVPTSNAAFLGTSAKPLATMTLRCLLGETVPFLLLETKGECKKWLPNWSSSGWDICYGESWVKNAGLACWAAHGHQGSVSIGFWVGVISLGIHP